MANEQSLMDEEKHVFRVQGFSCANCAGKFEKNVKQLSGVKDAQVNFGASKIAIYGEATIEELEKAGSFENLKVFPEKTSVKAIEKNKEKDHFIKKHQTLLTSFLFIVLGYISHFVNGESNIMTVLLFLSAIVIGGTSLFIVGFRNLIRADFDMKTLMTVAIIGAALIGEWAEGAIVVILFAISEALECFSMDRARKSIQSLMEIAPKEALIRRNGQEMLVSVDDIQINDRMLVKPGEKIAMDGIIVNGTSSVNQAAITGESIPVEKDKGDEVYAGTLNEEGFLEIKVTKHVDDTTLSKIIYLVEEAQAEKAPSQSFVDQFAKYYTPVIMIIAFLVAVIPPLMFGGNWEIWIYQGLAILVVGCPCALVISTPVSIVTAIGNAARHGLLIKGGIYLEEMGSVSAIAFDKTGTLTKGKPEVTDYLILDNKTNERNLLSHIATLEKHSQHPLGTAIMKEVEERNIPFGYNNIEEFSSITGKGIKGKIDGTLYYIGNQKLFEELYSVDSTVIQQMEILEEQGKTVMLIGTNREILAILAVADKLRETSKSVIQELHQLGVKHTMMLTGDNKRAAHAIGDSVGVTDIKAEVLPEEKLVAMKELQSNYGKVTMIGDGVNDAPALAVANVGIAMGGAGTDTALETADIALMGDDLTKIPFLVRLSRRALAIIKQNIAFSIGIKLLALLLVIPGWLTLWIAIIADMGATLIVTANGLRLLRVKE